MRDCGVGGPRGHQKSSPRRSWSLRWDSCGRKPALDDRDSQTCGRRRQGGNETPLRNRKGGHGNPPPTAHPARRGPRDAGAPKSRMRGPQVRFRGRGPGETRGPYPTRGGPRRRYAVRAFERRGPETLGESHSRAGGEEPADGFRAAMTTRMTPPPPTRCWASTTSAAESGVEPQAVSPPTPFSLSSTPTWLPRRPATLQAPWGGSARSRTGCAADRAGQSAPTQSAARYRQ